MKPRVHFIGINGSGASGVAIAALRAGFAVSGCDRSSDTPYAAQIAAAGIPVAADHDRAHVDAADIVACSAAFLEQKSTTDEIEYARAAGKLMKWQDFLGKYILAKKRLIAVCGTHGKTTTSSLTAHILESAGLDPTAFIGAIVPMWGGSSRVGAGEFAVIEADEYANNFAPYRPEIAVLNNLEMEHPEYFKDWEHYKKTFVDFLARARVVIYNADDAGTREILPQLSAEKIPFRAADYPGWPTPLIGAHNRANAMAAITAARAAGVPDEASRQALASFQTAGHRLQKIHDAAGVVVYDDYAHHHSQFKNTIAAVREAWPDYKIIAIAEPHQISRYAQNTPETLAALAAADAAVIVDFWRGREAHLTMPDVAADIAASGHKNIRFISDHDEAAEWAIAAAAPKTAIVVMGAGKSYKISQAITEILGAKK
ncbi:MAG: Mur ligase domain-containing protein [Rickettsiales bacterium]|jgi:UDP-N-acetylmuramate--alanine ligase|nr:Mur ligase domain-containing protein [Rickettsiales bacterium]